MEQDQNGNGNSSNNINNFKPKDTKRRQSILKSGYSVVEREATTATTNTTDNITLPLRRRVSFSEITHVKNMSPPSEMKIGSSRNPNLDIAAVGGEVGEMNYGDTQPQPSLLLGSRTVIGGISMEMSSNATFAVDEDINNANVHLSSSVIGHRTTMGQMSMEMSSNATFAVDEDINNANVHLSSSVIGHSTTMGQMSMEMSSNSTFVVDGEMNYRDQPSQFNRTEIVDLPMEMSSNSFGGDIDDNDIDSPDQFNRTAIVNMPMDMSSNSTFVVAGEMNNGNSPAEGDKTVRMDMSMDLSSSSNSNENCDNEDLLMDVSIPSIDTSIASVNSVTTVFESQLQFQEQPSAPKAKQNQPITVPQPTNTRFVVPKYLPPSLGLMAPPPTQNMKNEEYIQIMLKNPIQASSNPAPSYGKFGSAKTPTIRRPNIFSKYKPTTNCVTAATKPLATEPMLPKPLTLGPGAAKPVPPEPESLAPKPLASEPALPLPKQLAPKPVVSEQLTPKPVVSEPVPPKQLAPKPVVSEPVPRKPIASEQMRLLFPKLGIKTRYYLANYSTMSLSDKLDQWELIREELLQLDKEEYEIFYNHHHTAFRPNFLEYLRSVFEVREVAAIPFEEYDTHPAILKILGKL